MIIGWRHPLTRRLHDLTEYEAFEKVMPEPVLRAMVEKNRLDTRHQGTEITITSGLSCPRKMLVQRMLPTTPDPTKMWKMQRGTWLHEMVGLALGQNDDWWTEEVHEGHCLYDGKIFNVDMSCKIDALKKDYSHLMDWKFRGDGAERWVDPQGRAKDEDAAQLNMARLLMEQTLGRDLSDMEMTVWVMAGQTVRTTVPYMTEDQIGAIRPGGGNYTIREIFTYLNLAMEKWKGLGEDLYDDTKRSKRVEIIEAVPMVGNEMYSNKRGNMCTLYCEVQDECYKCSGGI